MKLDVDIIKVERIGIKKEEMLKLEKWRPLKLTLKNEEEKRKVMASVFKLAPDDFRITEDFSFKERKIIKEWHQKAKEKTTNEKEECCVWKVRGSPRTKLYFKRLCTRNDSHVDK